MNERFLCKAKGLDENNKGKWLVGYYYKGISDTDDKFKTLKECHYIGTLTENNELDTDYLIDTKTLCQCTGLKDKNGVLIFEGDYFWHMIEEGLVAHIVWSNDDLRWDVAIVPNVKANQCVPDFSNTLEWWELWEYGEIEIIGNIHDKE